MNRIERLRKSLENEGIDAFYLDNPIDLFYYTGQQMSAGRLFVDRESALLIVDGRYIEAVSGGPIEAELGDERWLGLYLERRPHVQSLGFDSRIVPFELYEKLAHFPIELRPMAGHLMEMRIVKEEGEIERLRKAAHLAARGYDHLLSLLEEGVSEAHLARQLEIFWIREGGEGFSFDPIIAFGANSSMPHYHTGESLLAIGAPALFDIGVQLGHYQSDMTRVRFLGDPTSKMQEIYSIVREAFDAAVELCRPGVTAGELDSAARGVIESAGYGEYFTHSLGHGVGLEVHEFPVLRSKSPHSERVIERGMVLTIEPGIYLPDQGGVRLEDTLVVTEDGLESLTKRPM